MGFFRSFGIFIFYGEGGIYEPNAGVVRRLLLTSSAARFCKLPAAIRGVLHRVNSL